MQDFKTFFRIIYQVYRILDRRQRMHLLGIMIVIFIGSLVELLGVSSMLPFIQSVLQPDELIKKRYIRVICDSIGIYQPTHIIFMCGVGIIVIYVLKNVYLAFSAYLQSSFNSRIQKDLTVLMLNSYMKQQYSFFVKNGSSYVIRGVLTDISGVFSIIQTGFKLLSEILVIISITIYLTSVDIWLTCGVILTGVLCMLMIVIGFKKSLAKASSILREAVDRQAKWILQITGGIKDILVYNRQSYFGKSYERASEDVCVASRYSNFVDALPERIIETFCISGIIITVLIRVGMNVDPTDYVPKLAVFAMGAFRLLPSISRSTGYVNNFVYYREWIESAHQNISEARSIEKAEDRSKYIESQILERNDASFETAIHIKELFWKYPENPRNVLEGVSFDINKGQTIGIIGESGSGKSTLSDIMLGLYRPERGSILMDDVDIRSIPFTWSQTIGYVPQAVFLVDDTVRENVIFGAGDPNDEKVWEALRKASLDSFVRGLPDGLDTVVGERGVKFSGGQRQRVAIARALYANPQILILDEATSALDNETEEAVMEAIDSLAGTMTLIIIAHRVTTLKGCDKIYEIVDGKAVERNKDEVISQA